MYVQKRKVVVSDAAGAFAQNGVRRGSRVQPVESKAEAEAAEAAPDAEETEEDAEVLQFFRGRSAFHTWEGLMDHQNAVDQMSVRKALALRKIQGIRSMQLKREDPASKELSRVIRRLDGSTEAIMQALGLSEGLAHADDASRRADSAPAAASAGDEAAADAKLPFPNSAASTAAVQGTSGAAAPAQMLQMQQAFATIVKQSMAGLRAEMARDREAAVSQAVAQLRAELAEDRSRLEAMESSLNRHFSKLEELMQAGPGTDLDLLVQQDRGGDTARRTGTIQPAAASTHTPVQSYEL